MFRPHWWPSSASSITKDLLQNFFKRLYAFFGFTAMLNQINPLTPELNPSVQR
jgi:hypothetical protein